jgi:hypothetical protein
MRREILYRALLSKFDATEAETIVEEVASLESQNIERLKDVFATKEDLHKELRALQHGLYTDLSNKIDTKVDKLYWFMLGQTAIMVGLILAILRTANVL